MNSRSRMLLAVLAACVVGAVQAAPPARSYAVMSLVGNAITVHGVRPSVGTRGGGEGEAFSVLPISDPVFDTAALVAADGAIKAAQPGANVVLLMTQDAGLYQAQNAMFDAPHANLENRNYLISLLKERGVSHLVLITKMRANANFKLVYGASGSGTLEGLGFYVDDTLQFYDAKTLDRGTGMLGPFAYVKVRLLDARTLELVREAKASSSLIVAHPSAMPNALETWTAMTSPQKIAHIEQLLGVAMGETIPQVLAQ